MTRLCPATALSGRFYKTGSRRVSYGCGTAAPGEGLGAALLSETFHRNGIATERVLAVIALPGGFAINVRAGRNLLRPSHFFVHSKQGDLDDAARRRRCLLRAADREWRLAPAAQRGASAIASSPSRRRSPSRASPPRFEAEYIFCWLAWDGDNILADGGIVDYGSVRQFGLYHREYRFDDVDRFSTSLPEQRRKARAIVQNFAQIRDFLIRGRKAPLASYAHDAVLRRFDAEFEAVSRRLLLYRIGLPGAIAEKLLHAAARPGRALPACARVLRARALGARPPGGSRRPLLECRVLLARPAARASDAAIAPPRCRSPREELLAIAASSYASRSDRALTPQRRRMASELQRAYLALLVGAAARAGRLSLASLLDRVARRSAVINRYDRITGDAVELASARLIRSRRQPRPRRAARR